MELDTPQLRCPACRSSEGWTTGQPFSGAWGIACHIAGCAQSGDRTHQRWLRNVFPDFRDKTLLAVAHEILDEVTGLIREQDSSSGLENGAEDEEEGIPASAYQVLSFVERRLHDFFRHALILEYGEDGERWWRQGVSLQIRRTCAVRREEDEEPKHSYHYVDLLDFGSIIDRQWRILEPLLQVAAEFFPRKQDWLDGIRRLNLVRRKVMHPARRDDPEDDEWELLESFHEAVSLLPVGDKETEVEEEEELPEWKRLLMELTSDDEEDEEE